MTIRAFNPAEKQIHDLMIIKSVLQSEVHIFAVLMVPTDNLKLISMETESDFPITIQAEGEIDPSNLMSYATCHPPCHKGYRVTWRNTLAPRSS